MTDRLPIYEIEHEIVARLKENQRLVLQAPTGSGKSTQLPQMLLEHGLLGNGQAVVLQPQPLAARLLAAKVAHERKAELGNEVGYEVHSDRLVGPTTKIRYASQDLFLRQMAQDPQLEGIQAIILDDFQQRQLAGDIILANARELQKNSRPDLLIVVMSATLPMGLLERYLEPASALTSEGKVFPVESEYLPQKTAPEEKPIWELAAEAFSQQLKAGATGDVLVFMPDTYEIQQTIEAIRQIPEASSFRLLPLHGELPSQEQEAAAASTEQSKVVVTNNVAEMSVTIEGIRLVIDSGLARIPRHDAHRGVTTFQIDKISRASADQRANCAARTAPGRCLRLWSSTEHWERPEYDVPEIKRLDLAEVVLNLKAAGVQDLRQFNWFEAPTDQVLKEAEELLVDLGALEKLEAPAAPAAAGEITAVAQAPATATPEPVVPGAATPVGTAADAQAQAVPTPTQATPGIEAAAPAEPAAAPVAAPVEPTSPTRITDLGRKMQALQVHPRYARMLLAGQEFGCVYQVCLVAALTQSRDLLVHNPGKEIQGEREDLLGHKATSDFWIVTRAWQYALQNNFRPETCRKAGIHASAARQVGPVLEQFLKIAKNAGLSAEERPPAPDLAEKCILLGYSDRVARRLNEGTLRCEMVHNRKGNLARESVVQQSPLLTAADIREVEAADKTQVTVFSLATVVQQDWLRELFPHDIHVESRVQFDSNTRRVSADEQVRFRDLAVAVRRIEPPPAEAASRMLAQEVMQKRLVLRNWDDAVEQWILRLNLLSRWCPELGLPPLKEEDRHHLIEQICEGAISYKDIKDREVKRVVQSWLSPEQQQALDKHAPERFTFSNGRTPKINYVSSGPPFIEIRIQELFGIKTSPKIALNRVTLLVHILAPNMRPVQSTQDLVSFWREHYPKAKKELQRKYPKHEWR